MDHPLDRKTLFIVEDLETLRILTDPLRMQILEILDLEPQTVNQVADKLGLSGSRLYYHFNLLESHGLIQVVRTRMVNNLLEKYYWVTAEDIDIDKTLLNFSSESGQENIAQVIVSSIENTRDDILRSLQARKMHLDQGAKPNPREMMITSAKKRLKDADYKAFTQRLNALMEAFNALPEVDGAEDEGQMFSLVCYLYPNYYFDLKKQPVDEEGQIINEK